MGARLIVVTSNIDDSGYNLQTYAVPSRVRHSDGIVVATELAALTVDACAWDERVGGAASSGGRSRRRHEELESRGPAGA